MRDWVVEDVCSWLHTLELDALIPQFKTNAVNGEDLLALTDDDFISSLKCTKLQVKVRWHLCDQCRRLHKVSISHRTTACVIVVF